MIVILGMVLTTQVQEPILGLELIQRDVIVQFTLNLTINNTSFSSVTRSECDNYSWNGVLYDSTGVYTYTTTNIFG